MSRGEDGVRNRVGGAAHQSIGRNFHTIFAPERQAIEQFDDLLGRLKGEPGSNVPARRGKDDG